MNLSINTATNKFFKQYPFNRAQTNPMGDTLFTKTANQNHYVDFNIQQKDVKAFQVGHGNLFYEKINQALSLVNQQVIKSDKFSEELIARPNSVNIHDVTIAAQRAQISLELTKNVIQRAISGYQSIINLR